MPITAHYGSLGGPAEMTPAPVRIATVHDECSLALQLALLDAIDGVLRDFGVERAWIDTAETSGMVVLAEGPPAEPAPDC